MCVAGRITTVGDALAAGVAALTAEGAVPSPRLDAEVLLAHVLDWNRARLYARPEYALTRERQQAYHAAIARRVRFEPVPYIVGHREFFGLDFLVDRRVLIPRPETELLVERALESARKPGLHSGTLLLADIGTGSGVVAVSLAKSLPNAQVDATDLSPSALEVATHNCERNGVIARVHLLPGELLQPLRGPVHVIAANLPYVPTATLHTLAPDVVRYEPLMALDGGTDGLQLIGRLLAKVKDYLLPGGVVVLEIGAGQGKQVVELAQQCLPSAQVELFRDYAGLERVVRVWTQGA